MRDYISLFQKDGYQHRRHNKNRLYVHLIFVTKYRKKILTGPLRDDIKQLMFDICKKYGYYIDRMDTDRAHIHILIQYSPKESVLEIVRHLKQESTYYIWKKYSGFLKRYYWAERTLWSDGYYASSIGEASLATIQKYIENQG